MQTWILIAVGSAALSADGLFVPVEESRGEGEVAVEAVPAPTPAPPTAAEILERERARRMDFFRAIARNDRETFERMLGEGIFPDASLIGPVPPEFLDGFQDPRLKYYLGSERGFTPLMLATALGNEMFVRTLLAAGADPHAKTKRHKTFPLWIAGKYGRIEIMRLLMGIGPGDEVREYYLFVDIGQQKATLYRGGEVLMQMPVSTGRSSHPTPRGWYVVTDKYEKWVSTLYRAKMPNFLRLSCGDFGLHGGNLPGYPASHGCIRLPREEARKLYSIVPRGTLVGIQ